MKAATQPVYDIIRKQIYYGSLLSGYLIKAFLQEVAFFLPTNLFEYAVFLEWTLSFRFMLFWISYVGYTLKGSFLKLDSPISIMLYRATVEWTLVISNFLMVLGVLLVCWVFALMLIVEVSMGFSADSLIEAIYFRKTDS